MLNLNLEKAWRLMDGDKALYRDLFQIIERTLEERYERIELALKTGSREDLEMYAHQLKGALRNVAAEAACELLFQLETCGIQGDLAQAKELYPLVRPAVAKVFAEFRAGLWEAAFNNFTRSGRAT
jgi:HPt (histidine-containing phosphotransfer) domain-containing protein